MTEGKCLLDDSGELTKIHYRSNFNDWFRISSAYRLDSSIHPATSIHWTKFRETYMLKMIRLLKNQKTLLYCQFSCIVSFVRAEIVIADYYIWMKKNIYFILLSISDVKYSMISPSVSITLCVEECVIPGIRQVIDIPRVVIV